MYTQKKSSTDKKRKLLAIIQHLICVDLLLVYHRELQIDFFFEFM